MDSHTGHLLSPITLHNMLLAAHVVLDSLPLRDSTKVLEKVTKSSLFLQGSIILERETVVKVVGKREQAV